MIINTPAAFALIAFALAFVAMRIATYVYRIEKLKADNDNDASLRSHVESMTADGYEMTEIAPHVHVNAIGAGYSDCCEEREMGWRKRNEPKQEESLDHD